MALIDTTPFEVGFISINGRKCWLDHDGRWTSFNRRQSHVRAYFDKYLSDNPVAEFHPCTFDEAERQDLLAEEWATEIAMARNGIHAI